MENTTLVSVDVGNVNTRFRDRGGKWIASPSLVRLPEGAGYAFETRTKAQPVTYLSGPASDTLPVGKQYLVGQDALATGGADQSTIGTAAWRVQSAGYQLLHLHAIAMSLPSRETTATVLFAGGLPSRDSDTPDVANAIKAWLHGTHRLQVGETAYTLTIKQSSFIPQPIGALASLIFNPDGTVAEGATRQRLVFDIGGGTTDYTGRNGLTLLPGSDGGIDLGMYDAAAFAARRIQKAHNRTTTAGEILDLLRKKESTLFVRGGAVDVSSEIQEGLADTAAQLIAQVLPSWRQWIGQSEMLIGGGGGQALYPHIKKAIPGASVSLIPKPLFCVAEGIERRAKSLLIQRKKAA